MINNKLFGLTFLRKHLAGVEGVNVLPWRVYRNPRDLKERHFRRETPRFLIRSNLDGNIHEIVWSDLPRGEISSLGEVRRTMSQLASAWRQAAEYEFAKDGLAQFGTNPNSLHFIVHPVQNRDAYVLNGSIRFVARSGNARILVSPITSVSWRDFVLRAPFIHESDKILRKLGALGESAPVVLHRAQQAIAELRKAASADARLRGMDWEANFSIRKGTDKLEFYDFLVKGEPRKEK